MIKSATLAFAVMFPLACPPVVWGSSPDSGSPSRAGADGDESRWLEKLDGEDRSALYRTLGFAAPEFTPSLHWIGSEATPLSSLKGKVVVLQTWSSKNSAGRRWPAKIAQLFQDAPDVRVLAVHTPEGAENAAAFLEQKPQSVPVIVDSNGEYCDQLGAFKRPVNFVLDKSGAVRYAGLNEKGLRLAVQKLIEEPYDAAATPRKRPDAEANDVKSVAFPTFDTPTSTPDFRGKRAPDLGKIQWLSPQPNATGKVVIIDFWATSCGPCRAMIPHMNELSDAFLDDVCVVGLTDESESQVKKGLSDNNLAPSAFRYCVATDTSGSMKKAFSINGIPHVVVISSDWVVRWQGHPSMLDRPTLKQIVDANKSAVAAAKSNATGSANRWAAELSSSKSRRG